MPIEGTARAIEELNALLRRELGSVALYEEALEGLCAAGTPLAESLRAMAREHVRNARTVRTEIARLGGAPAGAAGVFRALASEDDEYREEAMVVRALLACEERALRSYEDAARRLPGACAALVSEVLVPARRRHLARLHALLPAADVPVPGHTDCTPEEGTNASRKIPKEVAL